MFNNIITVASQVVILFILIAVGFTCGKTGLLKNSSINGMANLILYIVTPAVIINSFTIEFQPEKFRYLIITAVLTGIIHVIGIIFVKFFIKTPDITKNSVMKFSAVFSNCGYMAIPLQSALLGNDGVFYGSMYIAMHNVVMWTWGCRAMSPEVKTSAKQIILNPGIISIIIGILLFVSPVKLPNVIASPIGHLAALNTPIPMIITGYHLSHSEIKLKDIQEYIPLLYRLIICPVILIFILFITGIRGTVAISCIIAASAPVAAAVSMFSEKYDRDTSLSAKLVSVSTLLSIITMSVIVGIAQSLLV